MKVKTQDTNMGPFNPIRFSRLKRAYETNLSDKLPQFDFEGHMWARSFAYYMLTHLSPLLGFGEYKKPEHEGT